MKKIKDLVQYYKFLKAVVYSEKLWIIWEETYVVPTIEVSKEVTPATSPVTSALGLNWNKEHKHMIVTQLFREE